MNIKKANLGFIIIILVILLSFICQNNYKKKINKNCDSLHLIDSLILDAINRTFSSIYPLYQYKLDFNYVISNEFIPEGKEYNSSVVNKVISVNKNKFDTLSRGVISFQNIKFDLDSTKVELKIEYYMSNKFHARTNILNYSLDTINCKWLLVDSTFNLH